jgi:hypothetical protein
MPFHSIASSFRFPGYSQGDRLDGFQSLKILLINYVNDGDLSTVSSFLYRSLLLLPAVNDPMTLGDDELICCSTKQVVR